MLACTLWFLNLQDPDRRLRWVCWSKKKVIETVRGEDDSGYITSRYGITTAGMEWLISHTDLA